MFNFKFLKLFSIFLIILNYSQILAQQEGFEGGIKFGLNFLQIYGKDNNILKVDTAKSQNNGSGISIGTVLFLKMNARNYGIIELLFTQKGNVVLLKRDYRKNGIMLNYIEIPVIYERKVGNINSDLSYEIGLSYSKLLLSKLKYIELPRSFNNSAFTSLNKYDISILAGLKMPLFVKEENQQKRHHFLFNLRFSTSISSIHNKYKLYNAFGQFGLIYIIF
jgi:hypothetical protein